MATNDGSHVVFKKHASRLNNYEFRELIPHLPLEQLFLIQVKLDDKFNVLFNISYKNKLPANIYCGTCKQNSNCGDFMLHLKLLKHMESLNKVQQFYHPFYTYSKGAVKLANGQSVSEEERRRDLDKVSASLDKTVELKLMKAKSVAQYVKSFELSLESEKFEQVLKDLALKTPVKTPVGIIVDVSLPIEDLLKIEYCDDSGKWKPMLTTNNPHPNSKYYCAICAKFCAGIITVNAHLNGHNHKTQQLSQLGIRVKEYDQLTKYCGYRYDCNYEITIKQKGKDQLRDRVKEIIASEKKVALCAKLEKNAESEDDATVGTKENLSLEVDAETISATPLLSVIVAEKAKLLASNIPKSIILDINDVENGGLIGVEYVVKMIKYPFDSAPTYECCLCEEVLNESRMQAHLVSYNHRLKYIEMHYPDTINKYKDMIGHMKYIDFIRVMTPILDRLATAIEEHHGRSIPYVVSASKFTRNRAEIVAKVYSFLHACQQHGPLFSNVLTSKEIQELKSTSIEMYKAPHADQNYFGRFATIPKDKIYLRQKCHERRSRSQSPVARSKKNSNEHLIRSRSPVCYRSRSLRSRSRSLSPKLTSKKHIVKTQKRQHSYDIDESHEHLWATYRQEILVAASKVEAAYVEYRNFPESHPLYDQEWNRFWKQRKDELVSQGVDHRTHNFQPEWVCYFRDRLEELFGEELQKSKILVRKDLHIPLDAEEDCHPSPQPMYSSNISESAFDHGIQEYLNTKSHRDISEPVQKRTCFDIKSVGLEVNDNKQLQFSSPSWPSYTYSAGSAQPQNAFDDGKPNIIHVLRLVTAFEDHLGSLGSKIMELLSKSLVLEKTTKNSVQLERKILTAANCTLLETATEKLKGILYAGLLESNKVQGFNRVIQYTADLLKRADEMGCRSEIYGEEKTEDSSAIGLQKLLHAMQNKRVIPATLSSQQKSLSDTLMELISNQEKETSENYSSHKPSTPCENELETNATNFGQPSFARSNLIGSFNQSDSMNSQTSKVNLQKRNDFNNHMMYSNFNASANRNLQSFGYSTKQFKPNNSYNNNGSARNNFNNLNFNKKQNFNAINQMQPSNVGSSFGNNNASTFEAQNTNFSQITNMNRSNNTYRKQFGNSSTDNWGSNMKVWVNKQQQKQYQKHGSGGNM